MKSSLFGLTKKSAQELEEFEALKGQLEQQIKDISAEKSDVIRESQVLKDQLTRSEADLREANDRAAMYEEMVHQYENERRYQDESHDDIERLKGVEDECERVRRENDSLRNELFQREEEEREFGTRLSEKDSMIEDQKEIIGQNEQKIRELLSEIAARDEKAEEMDAPENAVKIQTLEKELRNKEILLKHYEDAEKSNIILTQDLQKARNLIKTLKKSISQLMEQMESQQIGIQYFAENITKQQNGLREKLQEMTELQLKNVELQDNLSNMTDMYETLKKKNETLLRENEALKQSMKQANSIPANIITPEKFEKKSQEIAVESKVSSALSRCDDAYANAKSLLSSILDDTDLEDDAFDMMS